MDVGHIDCVLEKWNNNVGRSDRSRQEYALYGSLRTTFSPFVKKSEEDRRLERYLGPDSTLSEKFPDHTLHLSGSRTHGLLRSKRGISIEDLEAVQGRTVLDIYEQGASQGQLRVIRAWGEHLLESIPKKSVYCGMPGDVCDGYFFIMTAGAVSLARHGEDIIDETSGLPGGIYDAPEVTTRVIPDFQTPVEFSPRDEEGAKLAELLGVHYEFGDPVNHSGIGVEADVGAVTKGLDGKHYAANVIQTGSDMGVKLSGRIAFFYLHALQSESVDERIKDVFLEVARNFNDERGVVTALRQFYNRFEQPKNSDSS